VEMRKIVIKTIEKVLTFWGVLLIIKNVY